MCKVIPLSPPEASVQIVPEHEYTVTGSEDIFFHHFRQAVVFNGYLRAFTFTNSTWLNPTMISGIEKDNKLLFFSLLLTILDSERSKNTHIICKNLLCDSCFTTTRKT